MPANNELDNTILILYVHTYRIVSRDFLLQIFFMNHLPPSPWKSQLHGSFEFFRKFAEIFTSQGAPPVSTTPAANLPPVSLTINNKNKITVNCTVHAQLLHAYLYSKGRYLTFFYYSRIICIFCYLLIKNY
jgi:hypothetical protein